MTHREIVWIWCLTHFLCQTFSRSVSKLNIFIYNGRIVLYFNSVQCVKVYPLADIYFFKCVAGKALPDRFNTVNLAGWCCFFNQLSIWNMIIKTVRFLQDVIYFKATGTVINWIRKSVGIVVYTGMYPRAGFGFRIGSIRNTIGRNNQTAKSTVWLQWIYLADIIVFLISFELV